MSAIVNVRYEFGPSPRYIRVARAADLSVHQAFQRDVLLYHPRDVKPAGFYAIARLVDFCPDFENHRFMYVSVDDIRPFPQAISAREYLRATRREVNEGWLYRTFAPGFRIIPEADLRVVAVMAGLKVGLGEDEHDPTPGAANPFEAKWLADPLTRETRILRDRQLRYEAFIAYGPACAVTNVQSFAPDGIGLEAEVCHFWAFGEHGPDTINNVMPCMRTVHWCFDKG